MSRSETPLDLIEEHSGQGLGEGVHRDPREHCGGWSVCLRDREEAGTGRGESRGLGLPSQPWGERPPDPLDTRPSLAAQLITVAAAARVIPVGILLSRQ